MLGHSAESSPEELLDVFKAAALSVTKLYKTSAAVQSKARIEGYQDCLEDLLTVLEKGDVDVRTIRRWVIERLDGREPILPTIESEDEVEKTDNSTPEPQTASAAANTAAVSTSNSNSNNNNNISHSATTSNNDTAMQTETENETEMETEGDATPSPAKNSRIATAPAVVAPAPTKKTKAKSRSATATTATTAAATTTTHIDTTPDNAEPAPVVQQNFDQFSFRSSVPYPTESFLELANLDLSDRRSASGSVKDSSEPPSSTAGASTYVFNAPPPSQTTSAADNASSSPSHTSGSRHIRVRHASGRPAVRSALTARMNRASAGQKRKLNFDEIFDLASLGYGKDVFGRGGGKRSRQA
ncbi:hypothetical protein SBRCBS47491_001774 [Sporothrix bragantina]|uniref:Uncharacterized protein n=1 Tax=Sporothrix bragantina TaxID=671064 RepID=A0ABP0B1B9_9PEZI